jgi:hypothetical protein
MTWRWRVLLPGLAGLVMLILGGRPCSAAGPWRGQVVDAETGQPLEGVIVVAVWDKLSPGAMHPQRDFHDALEVVTDAEGRFVIPARSLTTLNPFVNFEGPETYMFKSGYGLGPVRNLRPGGNKYDIYKLMEREGAIFTLRPLATKPERLMELTRPPGDIPDSLIPRYLDAFSAERVRLGLRPWPRKTPPTE